MRGRFSWVLIASAVGCGSSHSSNDDGSGGSAGKGAPGGASGRAGGDAGKASGGRVGSLGAGGVGAGGAQAGAKSSGGAGDAAGATDGGSDAGAGASTSAGTTGQGGSGATGAGAGGEAGSTETVPLPCTFPAISADTVHDWDVKVAGVSGSVTLMGVVMPDSPGVTSRGSLWFHDLDHGSSYVFPVGASGSADFSGLLFTSRYDVDFTTEDDVDLLAMPVGKSTRVASNVTIDADATFDFDVRTVSASGTLTANGGTVASSPPLGSRGNVILHDELTGSEYAIPINATSTASFSALVFASSYAVDFLTSPDSRLVGLPVDKTARLAQGIVLDADVSGLVYDLRPHTVGGNVLLNHAGMPSSPTVSSRGSVVFRTSPPGEDYSFPLSASGAAAYAGLVFEGTFDVDFATTDEYGLVGMPVNSAVRIGRGLAITQAGTHDLDLPVVTVDGTVTVDGAVMPDSPLTAHRGKMLFHDVATGTATELWVTPTGPAAFSGLVFESTYEVLFHSVPDPNLVGLPLDRSVEVREWEAITDDASFEYDVRPISVTGTLTANGAALPDSPALVSRGNVVLRDALSGQKYSVALSNTGSGSFAADLFASTYAVAFDTAQDETLVGLPSYDTAHLASRERLSASKSLAYDLTTVHASGVITLAGGELPSSPGVTTRGSAVFRDRFTGLGGGFRLGATGPGAYSLLLFPGSYSTAFWTTTDTDLVGLPLNVAKQLAVGCVPTRECRSSSDELSGSWLIQGGGLGELDADFEQNGDQLSGNFHGVTDGVFSSGTRDGDSVVLYTRDIFPCVPFGIRVTLVDPCTLVGTAFCGDETNPANVHEVRAIR